MNNAEARAQFIRILLDKVREDRHPSSTHMNLIEQILPPQWIPDYLEVLFEKIADEHNPSTDMLKRVARLVTQVR